MIPALALMSIIFALSSRTSNQLPNFDLFDTVVKKGGHALGYGLLALSYLYALKGKWGTGKPKWVLILAAWSLTILYALTDEFHQSFVPTRHASIWDVIVFDNLGALVALWLFGR